MADHLILSSLQPSPPFLFFSSSLHRPCRRFPGGIRFSVPELRLSSSQLQLANSTSPSQSSSSSSGNFDLVSTTQLEDGSHVFQFGDATEIERYLEIEAKLKKQNSKLLAEEASKVLRKQELKDHDRVSESDEPNLSNFIKIKDRKRVRSPTKKKKETLASVNVSQSEDKFASVSSLSSIVSVGEAIPTSFTEEKAVVSRKSEPSNENESTVESLSSQVMEKVSVNEDKVASPSILSSMVSVAAEAIPTSTIEEKLVVSRESEPRNEKESTVVLYNVEPLSSQVMEKVSVNEAKVASVSNVSSKVSVVEAIPTSSTEEEVVVSREHEPSNEKVESLSSEVVMDNGSVIEIGNCETTNGHQQLPENRMEVQARPRSSTSLHGSQSYDLEEEAHVSTIDLADNLDVRETPMKTVEAEENLVVEPTVTATVSPGEIITASEATHSSVDKIAKTPVTDMSEENLVIEPTATATVSPDELISASEATQHHSVNKVADTSVIDTPEVANEEETVASTIEDEIAVSDTKTDNGSLSKTVSDTEAEDLQLPALEKAGLESTEMVSDREELVSKALYLESGFASLQSPFKALAGREDAYFVSHHNWLGIAEGVSQWSFEGIKKGTYAQELMSNCQQIISDETTKIADPVQLLHRSLDETKSPGSSTALIAHLDNNELHVANIGDSGFMVIRNRKVLQKSSPMFHHFCFPLQITQGDDVLKLAEVYHVSLEEDDVIITATDGLYDNLYEKEMVAIVCRLLEQSLEPQKIAELVAAKAQEVGRSKTERTPFADAAKEEGYDGYKGGKLDDVTVIVSIVKTVSI